MPDPARSLEERRRLFALPRSSWQDYDKALISKGGGVFSRAEKQIALSPEMKKLLKLDKATRRARPRSSRRSCGRRSTCCGSAASAPMCEASSETNADVGDKANDAIRISALEIGAKVVGEGANLGMTQRRASPIRLKGGPAIPTRSTIPPGSTPRTSRSTSRSRWLRRCAAAGWPRTSALACLRR